MKDLRPLGGLSESAFVTGAPYTFVEARQILDIAAECRLTVVFVKTCFDLLISCHQINSFFFDTSDTARSNSRTYGVRFEASRMEFFERGRGFS